MKQYAYYFFIAQVCTLVLAQRVAPGVPPQHYQQPQMQHPQHQQMNQPQQVPQQQYQQEYQQVPVQHQQVPVQHQQVPVQHQQVPVQHQQVPVQQHVPVQHQQVPVTHQQQAHHPHAQGQQVLNTANIAQEKAHIAEHMEVPMDTSKMSEQELQFHYFKMHDADNNNKLDGCELIKSLIHWHEPQALEEGEASSEGMGHQDDSALAQFVDPIIDEMDKNKDGFVDYSEFIYATNER